METLTVIKINKKNATEKLKYESDSWDLFDKQLNVVDLFAYNNVKKELKKFIIFKINDKFSTDIYNIKIDWNNSINKKLIIYCYNKNLKLWR